MHFLVTIGYETEQLDRNGDPRLQKLKYALESESAEEAIIIASKYREGDTRASEIISVVQLPIECVISPKTHPEYYKSK